MAETLKKELSGSGEGVGVQDSKNPEKEKNKIKAKEKEGGGRVVFGVYIRDQKIGWSEDYDRAKRGLLFTKLTCMGVGRGT